MRKGNEPKFILINPNSSEQITALLKKLIISMIEKEDQTYLNQA